MTILLHCESSEEWLKTVLADFDTFLLDHAANEKKASGVALNLAAHYPDKPDLVTAMIDLAIEELSHYRDVFKLIRERHLTIPPDAKDPYVNQLRGLIRKGTENYFLDRLLVAGIIEARGLERFTKIAQALPSGPLKGFYQAIAHSEARHANLFVNLAKQHCPASDLQCRLDLLLTAEANILEQLPHRAMLH
ncbi:tRNA-(ms[2]io[6]A)-hydroxylase [Acaryochloris sp. IP29b_bin.137]|uniref:tRNA-(ms[2]io[6]A)-hydroxylase n=1 Tax=Acaryochloris sp. IP29b_bin.137 TaxID=2969217 RepID=UPI00261D1DD0|nr:tRNA-(ms[2]io[6]A)-hydroxylase [Acaryochloris sp. IP29b_bin.137]